VFFMMAEAQGEANVVKLAAKTNVHLRFRKLSSAFIGDDDVAGRFYATYAKHIELARANQERTSLPLR
jgi:hypothetical protein